MLTSFVALFMLSLCPFYISVGVWAFVIGLSQISSFFSQSYKTSDIYQNNDIYACVLISLKCLIYTYMFCISDEMKTTLIFI